MENKYVKALEDTAKAWNSFADIDLKYNSDNTNDFRQAIHTCQRIILHEAIIFSTPEELQEIKKHLR